MDWVSSVEDNHHRKGAREIYISLIAREMGNNMTGNIAYKLSADRLKVWRTERSDVEIS